MSKKVRGHWWRDKNGKLVWVPTYYRKKQSRPPVRPKGGDADTKK